MPFIALRLVPREPVTGTAFTTFLEGLQAGEELEIVALDVSFNDPLAADEAAAEIGTAQWDATIADSDIVQHEALLGAAPPGAPGPGSVATAVIEITSPPAAEYDGHDVIFVLRRDGDEIGRFAVDYNVAVQPGSPPADPADYPDDIPASAVAAYVPLRDPGLDALGLVELPEDGSPPNFTTLRTAVVAVMDQDPGSPPTMDADIAAMTVTQARHVAREIVWNRQVEPLPAPPGNLEDLYTSDAAQFNDDNGNRRQFEGELQGYRAELNTRAETLAQYVFALAAAINAELTSEGAERAGFRFPVLPGAAEPLSGKRREAEVLLKESSP